MSDPYDDAGGLAATPDDDLAADFVLGVLPRDMRADVEQRISADAAFAKNVEDWRARLVDFDTSAEEIAPSSALWQRIEGGIAPSPGRERAQPSSFTSWWHDLAAVRRAFASAAALALVCAGLAAYFHREARTTASLTPVYVAVLVSDATRQAGAVVSTFADGHAELVQLVDIDVPAGRALQVWTLWDRGVGPRSLGLLDRARSVRLELDRLPAPVSDQLFEITLEPAAGSPMSRPTGPILYKGTTARAL